jgi:hypothetical protein
LCSAKVIHTKNRIWRSASACQHHHPRRRRVSLSSGEGESAWRTDVTPGVAFGAGQNGCFCPPPVGHFSRANHGNFSRVPKLKRALLKSETLSRGFEPVSFGVAMNYRTSARSLTPRADLRVLVRYAAAFWPARHPPLRASHDAAAPLARPARPSPIIVATSSRHTSLNRCN